VEEKKNRTRKNMHCEPRQSLAFELTTRRGGHEPKTGEGKAATIMRCLTVQNDRHQPVTKEGAFRRVTARGQLKALYRGGNCRAKGDGERGQMKREKGAQQAAKKNMYQK